MPVSLPPPPLPHTHRTFQAIMFKAQVYQVGAEDQQWMRPFWGQDPPAQLITKIYESQLDSSVDFKELLENYQLFTTQVCSVIWLRYEWV